MFKDRIEAGFALAEKFKKYKGRDGIVLAVPKGGVPIGYVVARELGLPLEVILSKKIGHPLNKEYAIGAVSLWGSFVVPHEDVSSSYIERETARIRTYLEEMQAKFMEGKDPADIAGKTVIVIDDGIATGNTLLATINILRKKNPAGIVIAVPVSSRTAYNRLSSHVDELVVLEIPDYFSGVGACYEEFGDVSEEQVMYYLQKLKEKPDSIEKSNS
jgi:putative phosphoribosyl transferase